MHTLFRQLHGKDLEVTTGQIIMLYSLCPALTSCLGVQVPSMGMEDFAEVLCSYHTNMSTLSSHDLILNVVCMKKCD